MSVMRASGRVSIAGAGVGIMEAWGGGVFLVGDWQVSPQEGVLSRDGKTERLEPKAIEVLVYLASRPGEVVSRDDLERIVWHGAIVGYDAVTSTVIKLRKALGDSAREPRYIATIPKRGYQLIASVEHPAAEQVASRTVTGDPATRVISTASGRSVLPRSVLAAVLLCLAAGLLWFFLPATMRTDKQAMDSRSRQVTSTEPPTIIVLPFDNLSEPPLNDSFTDGITEDIITDLSGVSNLLVIASNTSFTFKEKQVSTRALAEELHVDFVLEGSIRRHGNSVRVNAQLVDAKTGLQQWAKRYDREVTEVFEVQDEVTRSIVDALAINLSPQEAERLTRRTTNSLVAYDQFQEGQRLSRISTRETNQQAQAAYRKAIAADPGYGRAYGALGYSLAYDYRRGWTDSPTQTIDLALELAQKAVELDNSIPQTHWSLGYVHLMRKEYDTAESAVASAVAIAPNYADGYGLLALIRNALGEPESAIALIQKGMQLNPYYTWDYPYNLGRAYYTLGRIEEAIETLEDARGRNPNAMPVRLHLAASYARAGRLGDAQWEVEEIRALSPAETISLLKAAHPIKDEERMSALIEDLRKAGMPE